MGYWNWGADGIGENGCLGLDATVLVTAEEPAVGSASRWSGLYLLRDDRRLDVRLGGEHAMKWQKREWLLVCGIVVDVTLKLFLIAALIDNSGADFVYRGF